MDGGWPSGGVKAGAADEMVVVPLATRFLWVLFLFLMLLSVCAGAMPIAAADPKPAVAGRPQSAVLIGPTRVTLVSGKTIEGIAVFRETGRIRVVLEDGSEISLDPAKVSSVVALADLPPQPAAASSGGRGTPSTKGAGGARTKGKAGIGTAGTRTGAAKRPPATQGSAAAKSGAAGTSRPRASEKLPSASAAGPPVPAGSQRANAGPVTADSGAGAATSGTHEARLRDKDIAELAGMLQESINNAELEGRRGPGQGGTREGAKGIAEENAEGGDGSSSDASAAGTTAGEEPGEEGEGEGSGDADGTGKEQPYHPKPEDFDATSPVLKPGFRFLGPKAEIPPTPPPLDDFPKPAEPVVSLKASKWKPKSGFTSSARWPKPLPPATDFSNALSGLGKPTTSFGPRWWNPPPVQWPSSTFPETWQPADGFALSQERKKQEQEGKKQEKEK
jgi:hypothetical protein